MLDFGSQNLAGSMDIEDGLDRKAQGSVEDSESGTGSQTNASKAIVGFSMAILAGLPAWYHLITWCCFVVHIVAVRYERHRTKMTLQYFASGILFGTTFDLPVDLMNGVFGEDHSKHIMDAWNPKSKNL